MEILEQTACGVSGGNLASQSINLHGDWIAKEDYFHRAAGHCIHYISAASFESFSVRMCDVLV